MLSWLTAAAWALGVCAPADIVTPAARPDPAPAVAPVAAPADTATPAIPASPAAASDTGIPAERALRAEPGRSMALDLGRGERLPFLWIEPLGLWVGLYEVTNGQYRRYDADHESSPYYGHVFDADDQPAVWVSWEDANNFCGWLTRHYRSRIPARYVVRLPTEREWQALAGCGAWRPYPWGRGWPPPDTFNFRGSEGIRLLYQWFHHAPYIRGHRDDFVATAPVTRSGVNEWGLYGMGGNVWEWCLDWFDGRQATRVLRGGCWDTFEPDRLALANRSDAHPDRSNAMIGFRVAVAPAIP